MTYFSTQCAYLFLNYCNDNEIVNQILISYFFLVMNNTIYYIFVIINNKVCPNKYNNNKYDETPSYITYIVIQNIQ